MASQLSEHLREDVQAIMDAIAVRSDVHLAIEKKARFRLNLRGSDLRGAMLMGANLAKCSCGDHLLDCRKWNHLALQETPIYLSEVMETLHIWPSVPRCRGRS